jgi:hypothetical protein
MGFHYSVVQGRNDRVDFLDEFAVFVFFGFNFEVNADAKEGHVGFYLILELLVVAVQIL